VADCTNCGGPLRIDRNRQVLACDHCGNQLESPVVFANLERLSESSTPCPVCTTPLSNSRWHGHPLRSCATCDGMLIDMNRFTTIIDAVRAHELASVGTALPRRQRPDDRRLACPLCAQPMIGHHYGGPGNVVIDTCERCLVNWLDQGELRRIGVAANKENIID
jgi:Zn-finger nucleic acid-binding protein